MSADMVYVVQGECGFLRVADTLGRAKVLAEFNASRLNRHIDASSFTGDKLGGDYERYDLRTPDTAWVLGSISGREIDRFTAEDQS